MRFVLSLAIACFALGFGGTQIASAQYPGAQYPGFAPQGYGGYSGYGHGHHHHHCPPSTPQYYAQYGAPALPYIPGGGYAPRYSLNPSYAQPTLPPGSIYYSNNNNYYGRPPITSQHPWHLGHYLLGN